MTTTRRFGDAKFGTFKFGPTVLTQPRFALEIDWDQDGLFDGRNDGKWMADLTIERGRRYYIRSDGKGFEPEETGRISALLIDLDNRYNPYNTSSELYPYIGPGRYFRARVRTLSDAIYPLMAGIISEPVPAPSGGLSQIHLEGRDGWQHLRDDKSQISLALQEGIFTDEAIQLVLQKISWPTLWGYDLASSATRQPFWWIEDQSASAAMFDLVFAELGRLWIAGDGKLTFRTRHENDAPIATITESDIVYGSLRISEPWEVVRNSIRIVTKPRTEQATGELWRLPEPIYIRPGETVDNVFAEFIYNNERVPAKNVIQPVPTTDYLAYANQDGSGLNLTGNISIPTDVFSTGAKPVITNNGASSAWLTWLRIRGNAIASGSISTIREDDFTNQQLIKSVRSFELDSNWVQNINAARSFAAYLKTFLTQGRKFLQFDLLPNPDLQFKMDLGKKVQVYLPDDGINETYRVHYLRHVSRDRGLMAFRTSLMLEPAPDLGGEDYWIVPHTVPMRVAY